METFSQWAKKIEDAEYDESKMICDVEIEEFTTFQQPKLLKPRIIGWGNIWEIMETYIPDKYFVPSDGECFLKCFDKAFSILEEEKYFECKEMIPPLYKKFCMKNKVKHDLFPMCKVGKFIDYIVENLEVFIPLYKYDIEKKWLREIRKGNISNRPRLCLFVHDFHFVLIWAPYLENIKEVQKENWIIKNITHNLPLKTQEINKEIVVAHDFEEQIKNVYIWDSETFFHR